MSWLILIGGIVIGVVVAVAVIFWLLSAAVSSVIGGKMW